MTERDAIKEAVKAASWPDMSEGEVLPHRYVVHCFRGFIGADWHVDDVLDLIDRAESVEFGPDLLGHNLRVVADGKLYRFDVPSQAVSA